MPGPLPGLEQGGTGGRSGSLLAAVRAGRISGCARTPVRILSYPDTESAHPREVRGVTILPRILAVSPPQESPKLVGGACSPCALATTGRPQVCSTLCPLVSD